MVDNDVLIKCACYRLLVGLLEGLGGAKSVGILGAARFVVANRLARSPLIEDRVAATAHWRGFLARAEELEPTTEEVTLATAIEEAANSAGAVLDGGESQLCAIAIQRNISRVLTGDKRAIAALEQILHAETALAPLAGCVACFEQVMQALVRTLGDAIVKKLVCAEPGADKSMSICFGCLGRLVDFDPSGLDSYVRDLRSRAPTILCETLTFT